MRRRPSLGETIESCDRVPWRGLQQQGASADLEPERKKLVLIRRTDLDAIVAGEVDLAFRRWKRPTVRTGGTLQTAVGVLAIHEVTAVESSEITESEAIRAGFETRATLIEKLGTRTGQLYRVRLTWAAEDPRVKLRNRADLADEETEEIRGRLERYDAASRHGPWTNRTLELIRDHPATLAAELAAIHAWDRAWFKTNVRKLKNLGLTESLKVGYRLSPRGQAFLDRAQP